MKVEAYVFQSPYPSAVQVGRPDPQSQTQEDTATAVDAISTAGNQTLRDAQGFKAQQSTGETPSGSSFTSMSSSFEKTVRVFVEAIHEFHALRD